VALAETDPETAEAAIEDMAKKLLGRDRQLIFVSASLIHHLVKPANDPILGALALNFILKIRNFETIGKLAAELQSIIAPLGMTAAASGFVSGPKALSGNPFHFTTWPEAWVKLYMENDFLLMDPLPRWARGSGRALAWSDLIRILPPRDAGRRVIEAGAKFGYLDGMAIPMRGNDNSLGLITIGGTRPAIPPEEQAFLTIIGRAAFEAAERIEHGGGSGKAAPIMTDREVECLGLLVQGHSDRQIAKILGISETTVRFHLGNAREKTGAVSRTHMAALAVKQGFATF
jgi:DNA-binding CsgD family transcriptional regulator